MFEYDSVIDSVETTRDRYEVFPDTTPAPEIG